MFLMMAANRTLKGLKIRTGSTFRRAAFGESAQGVGLAYESRWKVLGGVAVGTLDGNCA
jgi:hypothetical protein